MVYAFKRMPFGLNIALEVFMFSMKMFAKVWRRKGFLVFIHMDCALALGSSGDQVLRSIIETGNTSS